jgi:hypothetical protein
MVISKLMYFFVGSYLDKSYYIACGYPLGIGSIIKKGNWGRISKIESVGQGNISHTMELVFENIRLSEFPKLPSRFTSIFLCPNELCMREFLKQNRRTFDVPYEVELIDENAQIFETDWSIAPPTKYVNSTIKNIEEAARRYWNPTNLKDNLREILANSDVKIKNILVP